MSIQSFNLGKWASVSSSSLPVNSGLKWDQFNCGHCGTGGAFGRNGLCGGGFCPWLLPWAFPWAWLGFYFGFHLQLDHLNWPSFYNVNVFLSPLILHKFFNSMYHCYNIFFLWFFLQYLILNFFFIKQEFLLYFEDPRWAPMLCKVVQGQDTYFLYCYHIFLMSHLVYI